MNFMQAFKPAAAVYSVIGGEIRPYYGESFAVLIEPDWQKGRWL